MTARLRSRAVAALIALLALAILLLFVIPGVLILRATPLVPSGQNGFIAIIPAPSVSAVNAWSETYQVEPNQDTEVRFTLYVAIESTDADAKSSMPTILMHGAFANALQQGDCRGTDVRPHQQQDDIVSIESNQVWGDLNVTSQEAAKQYFTTNGSNNGPSVLTDAQNRLGTDSARAATYTVLHPLLADYTGSDREVDSDSFSHDIAPDEGTVVLPDAMSIELSCTLDGRALWHYEGDVRELRYPSLILIDSGTDGESRANLWLDRRLTVTEFPLVQFSNSNASSSFANGYRTFDIDAASGFETDASGATGLRAVALDSVSIQFIDQGATDYRQTQIALSGVAAGVVASLLLALWRVINYWATGTPEGPGRKE